MLKSQSGIGLIEIVIAMLIFGIGITATTRARNISVATNLAQAKIEALMGASLTGADLSAGTHDDPLNPLQRHFTRMWTVTDNSPITGMKVLSVTVTYAGRGNDRSVTLTTFLTSRR
jgi:Tfp pilus assembly protein PilV